MIFRFCGDFGVLLVAFGSIFGSQRGPWEVIFSYFFGCQFWLIFSTSFSKKTWKNKKWKSVVRYVNYDVSWGSPCPQKYKKAFKKPMKNTMVFGSKIDENFMKKLVVAAFTAKIEKITVVGPQLGGKTRFFANLGVPGGTQKSWKLAAHFGKKTLENNGPFKNS